MSDSPIRSLPMFKRIRGCAMRLVAVAAWAVLIGAPGGALAQDSSGSSSFADGCGAGPGQIDCLRQDEGFGQSGLSGTPFGIGTFGSGAFGGAASVLDRLGIPAVGGMSGSSSPAGTTPSVSSSSTSPTPPADSQGTTDTSSSGSVTLGSEAPGTAGGAVSEFDEDPLLDPFE
jgi:hypothetical protein